MDNSLRACDESNGTTERSATSSELPLLSISLRALISDATPTPTSRHAESHLPRLRSKCRRRTPPSASLGAGVRRGGPSSAGAASASRPTPLTTNSRRPSTRRRLVTALQSLAGGAPRRRRSSRRWATSTSRSSHPTTRYRRGTSCHTSSKSPLQERPLTSRRLWCQSLCTHSLRPTPPWSRRTPRLL